MSLSFRAAAREDPDRVALVAGGEEFTFRRFLPFVAGAMARLRSLRAGNEGGPARVVFPASPRPGTLALLYALIEMGIPFVPLDPRWTAPERERILAETDRAAVFKEEPSLETGADDPARGGVSVPDRDRPLATLYTSGSSGAPRGVVLSRRAFVAGAAASAANLRWRDDDRWALSMPLARVGGLSIVTRCLIARRAVVAAAPFRAARLARIIARDRVTLLSAVPAMIRALFDLRPLWRPPGHLRAVLLGGGPVPEEMLAEGIRRRVPLLPTYGMTETCAQVATAPYGKTAREAAVPPLPGIEVRVREGRVLVRGPMLMTSYHPPGAHVDPFVGEGWLVTNDRGVLDDSGRLRILGRLDRVAVSGGENVGLREVEEGLLEIDGIAEACAFGIEDARWGEIVAAAVAPREGILLDRGILAARIARRLAPPKRPRRIAVLDRIPKTLSGAIDREEARRKGEDRLETLHYS